MTPVARPRADREAKPSLPSRRRGAERASEYPQAQPAVPTLLRAGRAPQTYPTLVHLAADLAALLTQDPDGRHGGVPRELVLIRVAATYPGFDTFPAFSVHGVPRNRGEKPGQGTWLCAVAIQQTPPQDLDDLVTKALGRTPTAVIPVSQREDRDPSPRIAVRAGGGR